MVGEEGIIEELEKSGFEYLGGPKDGEVKIVLSKGYFLPHDENVFISNF